MTCNDPNCPACQLRREHPNEDRITLILELSDVMWALVSSFSAAEEVMHGEAGELAAAVGGEQARLQLLNKNIFKFFARELPNYEQAFHILSSVMLAALPPEVVGLAKQTYERSVRRAIADDHPEVSDEAVGNTLEHAMKIIEQLHNAGRSYLSGANEHAGSRADFGLGGTLQ